MDISVLRDTISRIAKLTQSLSSETSQLQQWLGYAGGASDPFISYLTIFVLSCFLGYYIIWRVTPSLHSPLMAVTNAISSVVIVGALIAAGPDIVDSSSFFGILAVFLVSINIFGGFMITERMLSMFKNK